MNTSAGLLCVLPWEKITSLTDWLQHERSKHKLYLVALPLCRLLARQDARDRRGDAVCPAELAIHDSRFTAACKDNRDITEHQHGLTLQDNGF